MIGMNPKGSSSQLDQAVSLLQAFSDPDAAKKRLEEIHDAMLKAEKAEAKAREEQGKLVVQREELSKELNRLKSYEKSLIAKEKQLADFQDGLAVRSDDINQKAGQLSDTLDEIEKTKKDLVARENGVRQQKSALSDEKEKLRILSDKLKEDQAEIDRKKAILAQL